MLRHPMRKSIEMTSRFIMLVLVLVMLISPISPSEAEAISEQMKLTSVEARGFLDSFYNVLVGSRYLPLKASSKAQPEDPRDRIARVAQIQLCPRRLVLHAGEALVLVPKPLDLNGETVQGVGFYYESDNPAVAAVSSLGEVSAVAVGNTVVTARVGAASARVMVQVRDDAKPVKSDTDWQLDHQGDCTEPLSAGLDTFPSMSLDSSVSSDGQSRVEGERPIAERASLDLKQGSVIARPALLAVKRPRVKPAVLPRGAASAAAPQLAPIIEGDSPDTISPNVGLFNNAIGNPRFSAVETTEMSPVKTRKNLGSHNYSFSAPVISLGGRGVGVDLDLVYNSRVWTKDGSTMTFNYNKGWPAPGWTLGYGRIIRNYDNTGQGDRSGNGLNNRPGNFLLIQPDGTRVHLRFSVSLGYRLR